MVPRKPSALAVGRMSQEALRFSGREDVTVETTVTGFSEPIPLSYAIVHLPGYPHFTLLFTAKPETKRVVVYHNPNVCFLECVP